MVNHATAPGEVVLVTGGSGFLGQHIVRLLQERDTSVAEIRVLDLKPYVNKLDHAEQKPLHSFVGDIRDVETMRDAFKGVHCVIHCAALVCYRFPPDIKGLQDTNVEGTQNVITLCLEEGVPRLVFTCTTEVTLVPYFKSIFSVIVNQTETKALPPISETSLVIPGYPASKLRAERLVLEANEQKHTKGPGCLRTVSLRPTLMYGEQDPRLLPPLIRFANANDGRLVQFAGAGGKNQFTYAGNAAWAHLRAKDQLRLEPSGVAGLPVFITDDTPADDLLRFSERLTSSADAPPRCRVTRWYVPSVLAYLAAAVLETGASLLRVSLPVPPRAVVSYLGSIVYYNRLRAAIHLDYTPIVSPQEAKKRSSVYYTREKL